MGYYLNVKEEEKAETSVSDPANNSRYYKVNGRDIHVNMRPKVFQRQPITIFMKPKK